MEAIKDTIKNVISNLRLQKKGQDKDGFGVLLRRCLTKRELGHMKVNYFKRGVLGISVDSSSWLYQLSLQKEDLLVKLSKRSKAIKDIRLRLGELK